MTGDFVALLGTKGGPAIRPGSSMPTSNLLCLDGRRIVVDCGLGVTRGLVDQGMQLKDLSMICITHLHSDHYLELGPLIHTAWTAGLKTPVEVWGPPGLDIYWNGFLASMKADIDTRIEDEGRPDLRKLVRIKAIDAGMFFDRDGLTVSAIRTQHPPLEDCFALSFRSERTHVVFSGDTAPIPDLVDFAHGANLLIHEAMLQSALPALMSRIGNGSEKLMEHWLRSHSFAHDAARTAVRAGVKGLALSHLIPSDDPAYTEEHWSKAVEGIWDGKLFVGRDGLRIALPIREDSAPPLT
ncbi:MBL fold metallo-hydrolase [Rhodophyticola sp. CCM32]|uniref:MBL fold metallo-hydrolase n=1 Tax=Rhodophyticola sp. CCM32 TaxID=2916397 RepID=UPI00107F39F9|nr:MBL fold metallo-hydrolase [Rhodophyticola sp. CCM32]QBY01458.1 MBL fold metallo-hydrolase [Rhodophyticola sp. CCM32]